MSIQSWPLHERPRERLLKYGATQLSDAELLAIFIRTGVKGKTAVDLGRELLSHFGSLRELLNADQQMFCQLQGMGVAKYTQFQAALELGQRYLSDHLREQDALTNPWHTHHYLKQKLRDQEHEVFACLFLDTKNQVLGYKELFRGTLNRSAVYPREVVKEALQHNAASVILAHNHPSGSPEPSQSDKDLTKLLIKALATVDIRVLDHIVIGNKELFSFAQKELL